MLVTVLVAPFVEEFTKGVVILVLLKMRKIDNMTDGILLGIVIGLGFAASENVHYALKVVYPYSGELAMWHNLWFREIHTTLLHASACAVWGAMIGYSRNFKGVQQFFALLIGFILSMVTHGFWNFMATFVGSIKASFNLIEVAMRMELVVIFGMLMTLYFGSVISESRVIVRELLEEYEKGVIPKEHIGFFASVVRISKRYNLPKKVKPKVYAKLGVRLAFRKHDYRIHPRPELLQEIHVLREKLKKISEYKPGSLSLRYGK